MLAGVELGALQGCKQLQELNLRGCYKLTNLSVAALQKLTALTLLNLHECWQITAAGMASLSSKASLRALIFLSVKHILQRKLHFSAPALWGVYFQVSSSKHWEMCCNIAAMSHEEAIVSSY